MCKVMLFFVSLDYRKVGGGGWFNRKKLEILQSLALIEKEHFGRGPLLTVKICHVQDSALVLHRHNSYGRVDFQVPKGARHLPLIDLQRELSV